MNCEGFEGLITDLARGSAVAETVRAEALAHAQVCSRCAARLADEQALTAALRLAAADTASAPAHLEAALISAYRIHRQAPTRGACAGRFARVRLLSYRALAAALILGLLGVSAYWLLHSRQGDRGRAAGLPSGAAPAGDLSKPEAELKPAAAAPMAAAPAPKTRLTPERPGRLKSGRPSPELLEIASDFIPLTADAPLFPMESGQLVRVLLPRSALASCGLPVNQELANKPVIAYVLIGQDGVARAIRFVSDSAVSVVRAGT